MLKSETGMKETLGKAPFELIPPHFLDDFAEVLKFGAAKYAPYNWCKGIDAELHAAAIMRHTQAIRRGEHINEETGIHHGVSVAINGMFLSELYRMNKLPQELIKNYQAETESANSNVN